MERDSGDERAPDPESAAPTGVEADQRDTEPLETEEEELPLARVRYGLGKELRLFDESFVIVQREVRDEIAVRLDNIERVILTPGEHTPSKLVLMFELDDGNVMIAAEGMTNVRDFRRLLARLQEIRPGIELDPPDMDEQLMQALDIKRRTQIGCYGILFGSCLLVMFIYLVVALIGAHAPH
ncbi:MAG TPA: hypothetical protein VJN88_02340 [Ktedonobacterales bacterium]|nr:hypothetical protein [Ktedonobacterales bacterium]